MSQLGAIQRQINRMSKVRLGCGKNLLELTTYKGVCLWFFVSYKYFVFLDFLSRGSSMGFGSRERLIGLLYRPLEPLVDLFGLALVRVMLLCFSRRRVDGCGPKIIFTAQDMQWRAIGKGKSDIFFSPLWEELKTRGRYQLLGVYSLAPSKRSLRVFAEKLRIWEIDQCPFNLFWSPGIWWREQACYGHFLRAWSKIRKDDSSHNLLSIPGEEGGECELARFQYYFTVLMPHFYKYVQMGMRMIERESPDLIVLLNEYGDMERALVIAAKEMGVPTLAIQHGIITPYHYGYIFDPEDRGFVALPDVTCIYGQYHYNLLTKQSIYMPSELVITGQPRYDQLYSASKIFSKESFRRRLGIDAGKRIALWAPAFYGSPDEENMHTARALFEATQGIRDITLLIKLHPGDGEDHIRAVSELGRQYEVEMHVMSRMHDIFELLYVCDIMITKNSTTAMEAVALKKPAIILNLSGQPDLVDYVAEGVALGVYREEDLRPAISSLLQDPSGLAARQEAYIQRFLFKVDGRASERVVDVIQRLIKSKED